MFTFAAHKLAELLTLYEVERPGDVPESALRMLCSMATGPLRDQQLDGAEELSPGGVSLVVGDAAAGGLHLDSADVGIDMLKRFVPELDADTELLFDPQYSPVDVEVRVWDPLETEKDPARALGKQVLATTLQPPNLA